MGLWLTVCGNDHGAVEPKVARVDHVDQERDVRIRDPVRHVGLPCERVCVRMWVNVGGCESTGVLFRVSKARARSRSLFVGGWVWRAAFVNERDRSGVGTATHVLETRRMRVSSVLAQVGDSRRTKGGNQGLVRTRRSSEGRKLSAKNQMGRGRAGRGGRGGEGGGALVPSRYVVM